MQFFVEMRRDRAAAGFSTFDEFLARTANEDRQFLTVEELPLFAPTACGMANGAGGWVVLGAEWLEEEARGAGAPEPGRAIRHGTAGPHAWHLSGAQLLNVACGGSLYQDIGERGEDHLTHVQAEKRHVVTQTARVVSGTRLARL